MGAEFTSVRGVRFEVIRSDHPQVGSGRVMALVGETFAALYCPLGWSSRQRPDSLRKWAVLFRGGRPLTTDGGRVRTFTHPHLAAEAGMTATCVCRRGTSRRRPAS
jgi:hypothetical protein